MKAAVWCGQTAILLSTLANTNTLFRLLYGRMQRWTGVGSGGKAGGGARRAVVLRFLASCPVSEMKVFMDLILAPFMHLYRGKVLHWCTARFSCLSSVLILQSLGEFGKWYSLYISLLSLLNYWFCITPWGEYRVQLIAFSLKWLNCVRRQ